jgi:hypothetical protein
MGATKVRFHSICFHFSILSIHLGFGFVEFKFADGLQRAIRLVPLIQIDGRWLDVHIDSSASGYIELCQGQMNAFLASHPAFQTPLQKDGEVVQQLKDYLATRRLSSYSVGQARPSEDGKKASANANGDEEEEGTVDEEWTRHEEEEQSRMAHMYRDRLKKWEARELALLRERRREQDKLEELIHRKAKMKQALGKFIERFDFDAHLPPRHEAENMMDFSLIPDGPLLLDRLYKKHDSIGTKRK